MGALRDLENRADIEALIQRFYEQAMADEQIGHFFTEVVQLDLESHLPKICDFWETVLFSVPKYKGSPLEAHAEMHKKRALRKSDFDRWIALFQATVDELYEGPTAATAKHRASSIAHIMQSQLERIARHDG